MAIATNTGIKYYCDKCGKEDLTLYHKLDKFEILFDCDCTEEISLRKEE